MLSNFPHLNRRHFLKHTAGAAAMLAGGSQFVSQLQAAGSALKKNNKHIIILWMGGGPPATDIWDPAETEGNTKLWDRLNTSAKGVYISASMPKMAEQFKHMAVIRSLNSQEGDHGRGTFRMNTGFPPSTLGVTIPHLGSIVSNYCGSADAPLQFVSVGGTALRIGSGFLGAALAPFQVQNAGTVPENIKMPQMGDPRVSAARGQRRASILGELEKNFKFSITPHMTKESDRKSFADAAQQHDELVRKALDISMKSGAKTFEFDAADTKKLEKFGNNGFGKGCLLATKLVKAGVTAVEVDLGGWDMHGNVKAGVERQASGMVDPGMASMVDLLNAEGLLKDTLVFWAGDFGRTPRVNQNAGRDHWSAGWSVVLGGAGIKPGVAYGSMNAEGTAIKDNPVSVSQLYATMYTALGIDLNDRNLDLHDNLGRRYYIAGEKENAKPIKELLS